MSIIDKNIVKKVIDYLHCKDESFDKEIAINQIIKEEILNNFDKYYFVNYAICRNEYGESIEIYLDERHQSAMKFIIYKK